MNEMVIQRHKFDISKEQLKKFLNNMPETPELKKVSPDGGFLYLFDHKVTGNELNSLTAQIEKYLIDFSKLHENHFEEARQIYETIDALDDEYINSINIAFNTAIKALKEEQENLQKNFTLHGKEIEKIIGLETKLDACEHFEEIDKMWENLCSIKTDISLNNSIAKRHEEQMSHIKNLIIEADMPSINAIIERQEKELDNIKTVVFDERKNYKAISKKMKVLYALAGTSIGIAIVEFILLLSGIL